MSPLVFHGDLHTRGHTDVPGQTHWISKLKKIKHMIIEKGLMERMSVGRGWKVIGKYRKPE